MKFKINKADFYQAIQNIIGVIPTKTTLPILSNVLLDLQENTLNLTGTDLEVSISTQIPVQGDEDGAVAIPAKRLFDIVRELPDIPLEFNVDESFKVLLNTDNGFYRISGESKEDFPKATKDEESGSFTVDSERFMNMINKTIFAVSADELRTTLMGVFLKVMENELRMVSTDGHRLAKIVDKGFKSAGLERETVIPTKALNLLLKNQSSKEINVKLSDDHIIFELGNTIIHSKCIEGQFPNYERVIPMDNDKELIVNRDLLSSSVRRVAIFSNSITNQIRLSISNNLVKIQSEDIEFGGEARESIDSEYNGDDIEIGYNATYLLDILRHVDTEDVVFKLKDAISAGLIYPSSQQEDEDVMMLLMPIRLNED
ncbi:MAG: DNA polymerase III subunit beta [bacterium]